MHVIFFYNLEGNFFYGFGFTKAEKSVFTSFSDSLSDVQRLVFLKAVGICTV